jgi:hypothetical protein
MQYEEMQCDGTRQHYDGSNHPYSGGQQDAATLAQTSYEAVEEGASIKLGRG